MTHNRAMTDESDSRRVPDQSPQQPEVLLPSAGVSGSLEEQRSAHVQWSQFLETSPDPMWIKDPAGRYLTVNQAFFDYLSFRREEVLDHTDWEIYPAEIASRFQDEDRRVMEEGSLYYEDSEIRDGHESHFLIRKRRIVGEDGRIAGILGLATDVTERKRMEEELHQRTRQALHLQKALLELSKLDPSVTQVSLAKILEVDAHALQVERVSYWSLGLEGLPDTCEDQYTKSRGEHEWCEVMYLSHYPDYFRHLTEDRAVVADDAQQDPATCEFTEWFLRPRGITSLLDVPVRRQGRIVGVVCHEHIGPPRRWTVEEEEFAASVADQVSLLLETAERQAAEEALRLSEERFRLALESASEGLWDWDISSGQAYFGPRYYT
ncbi:MAG: PAS domain-containing protein, partial [Chloroflexi bacterium]|nr:PAS domain-containing protein [Chloroflexota bacterium]